MVKYLNAHNYTHDYEHHPPISTRTTSDFDRMASEEIGAIALRIVELQKRRKELVKQKARVEDSVKMQEDIDKDRADIGGKFKHLTNINNGLNGLQMCSMMESVFEAFGKMMENKNILKHNDPTVFLKDVDEQIVATKSSDQATKNTLKTLILAVAAKTIYWIECNDWEYLRLCGVGRIISI